MEDHKLVHDIIIIGGGPAGLAAAIGAKEEGIEDILILEREDHLGGILNQCIHNGFGLHTFKEELTGPEYGKRYIQKVEEMKIPYKLNTMVIDLDKEKAVTAVNEDDGVMVMKAKAIILAMGCRERPRGALLIPGSRPAGIYTAGTAQKYVNIDGFMPGREVVILGSGDIGLIMARRMTLEGAKVKLVAELLPYSGGLKRNVVQCLDDFNIPLKLSHTIVKIHGKERITGVTVAKVDENKKPVRETEEFISCDTLLLSVGLIPENELSAKAMIELSDITGGPIVNESLQTNAAGVFACGNVLHVHDLVDYVSEESTLAGKNAANYVRGKIFDQGTIEVKTGNGVRYTVPKYITPGNATKSIPIRFRVSDVYHGKHIGIYFDQEKEMDIKKRILTPGEMETIKISGAVIDKYPNCKTIKIQVEGE